MELRNLKLKEEKPCVTALHHMFAVRYFLADIQKCFGLSPLFHLSLFSPLSLLITVEPVLDGSLAPLILAASGTEGGREQRSSSAPGLLFNWSFSQLVFVGLMQQDFNRRFC